MRSLSHALQEHELIVLRVIGEWWEIDLTGADKKECVHTLSERLPELVHVPEEIIYMSDEEADAMRTLVRGHGRVAVATFRRRFGELRQMGPGALEREEPWMSPISPAEQLWYRGLIYRGFDETDEGMVEFVYLLHEFYEQFEQAEYVTEPLPPPVEDTVAADMAAAETDANEAGEGTAEEPPSYEPLPPEPEPPQEPVQTAVAAPARYEAATTDAVDDVTTVLALAQGGNVRVGEGRRLRPYLYDPSLPRLALLTTLAVDLGLLRQVDDVYRPTRAAVGWLRSTREAQIRALAQGWLETGWNELRHVPTLVCEGSGWSNEPITARRILLKFMTVEEGWFSIADLVGEIKNEQPDFQRPNGNYDTWYIRDRATDQYVTGFENWELVEGRLLHYLIEGPLAWLGLVEHGEGMFRLTGRGVSWLRDNALPEKEVTIPLVVQKDGGLLVPYNANRYHRFQAARVAEMAVPVTKGEPYRYRLTPTSLTAAQEQGITAQRVLEFLKDAGGRPLPATTRRAIERWAENGLEGRMESVVILRVSDAEILQKLRQHPKARPYIGESLGDLAAVVQGDDWSALCRVAASLGLLLQPPAERRV